MPLYTLTLVLMDSLDIVADTEIQIAATTIDINGAIVASGEISAASLDISGDVDIDGTLNVDAIDIDGAVQLDNTLTVGVDDTGYDVKFYGATGGAYMLWDESADDLILAGAGGLVVAGNVDFNGDLDVDGTTNLDVVDIDGAVDMASTLNVAGAFTSLGIDDNANANAITIDSSERIMMGHTSAIQGHRLEVTGAGTAAVGVFRFDASATAPTVDLRKSRNATIGGHTILQDGDYFGRLDFKGSDGTGWIFGAQISASVDGTPGTNDMPGKLEFRTTPDGSTALATRLTIDNVGAFTTNPAAGGHAVFNEGGVDADFRVESDATHICCL
jgi:cytoskeletal protein CcmA (bactofilin family)